MKKSEELLSLAKIVNVSLLNYIDVHNLIFKDSATLKSLFKNLIGKGISNKELLLQSENLKPKWILISKQITNYKVNEFHKLNEVEKVFLETLQSYVESINYTVELLIERQLLLYKKSINDINTDYSSNRYNDVLKSYEQSLIVYRKFGEKLNLDYRRLL